VGLVNVDTLRDVPPYERASRRVADFTMPLSVLRTATPDDPLAEVIALSGRARVGNVVVFDGDRLVGVISPEAVAARQDVSRATP
jgi:hypothetical protein